MTIALTLQQYLDDYDIPYEVVAHRRTLTARQTARASGIPAACLAKAVVLRDGRGYLMAVLPASCRLDQAQLRRLLDRPVELAEEDEAHMLFKDCAYGAIPAVGEAYGLETVLDERLERVPEIWLEAGDHEHLVHLAGERFRGLLAGARHGSFAHA
jgi:Ala-tRNA(Pro) deacylase